MVRGGQLCFMVVTVLLRTSKIELVTKGSDAYVSENTNDPYKISEGLSGSEDCTQ